MLDSFLDTGIYILGIVAILLIGLRLVFGGVWGVSNDRSNWYHIRWRRLVIGVVLAFLSVFLVEWPAAHPRASVYLLGIALIPGVGLMLVCWGLRGDRSKGRVRCPKCWYDMRGTVPRLECPECGHDAGQESQFYRTRRGRRRMIVGVLLAILWAVYPTAIIVGWLHEQSIERRYGLAYFAPTRIGPVGLVDQLPDELARFFDRRVRLEIDDLAQLPACRSLRHLREL